MAWPRWLIELLYGTHVELETWCLGRYRGVRYRFHLGHATVELEFGCLDSTLTSNLKHTAQSSSPSYIEDEIDFQVQLYTQGLICTWTWSQLRDMLRDLDSTVYTQHELEYCQTSELQTRLKMVPERTRQTNRENELVDCCWILNLSFYESQQLVVHCIDKSGIELAITGLNAMYNKLQEVSTLNWLSNWTYVWSMTWLLI